MVASRSREPEAFEGIAESMPGGTALEDLTAEEPTEAGAARIITRFIALRFLIMARDGVTTRDMLEEERRAAVPYASALRAPPSEARALRALVALGRPQPPRRIMSFVHDAAETARVSGHTRGAFALHGFGYGLSVERGWDVEAARAAESIAVIAAQEGGVRAPRLWRRRAHVLWRRAERE